MIASKTLLNTPLTPRTFLRRLCYNLLTCNFFLFLKILIRPKLVNTYMSHSR